MSENALTQNEQEIYKYVGWYRIDDDPKQAVDNITHDFDMTMSDSMRGRIKENSQELKAMYEAYRVLCARAGVVPHSWQVIYTGNRTFAHNGEFPTNKDSETNDQE